MTSGKSLPLSGPWSPVSEISKAKLSKVFQNSVILRSCWGSGVLGQGAGVRGLDSRDLLFLPQSRRDGGGQREKRSPRPPGGCSRGQGESEVLETYLFKCPVSPGAFSLGFEMLQKPALGLCVCAEQNMGCIYSSFSPSP